MPRDRYILHGKRIEHRPHGLADQGLPEIEFAQRAALRNKDKRRNLRRDDQGRQRVRDGSETAGLHEHGAAHAAHPRSRDDAKRFLFACCSEGSEEPVGT